MYEKIEKPSAKGCAKCLKIVNIVAAICVMAFGVVGLFYMIINNLISERFFLVFNPLFIILFGVMMVATEFKIEVILKECPFLTHFLGRGIFFIYISSAVYWCFAFGTNDGTMAWISSITIFGLGIFYLALHFCAGGYTDQLRDEMKPNDPKENI